MILRNLLSPEPLSLATALGTVRIIVGGLILYHGLEVFDAELMRSYTEWDTFKGENAFLLVYAGKSSEFIAGLLLFTGFLTRAGALLAAGTLSYITFFVGQGRFWYEDQHPFMFVLFGILFFFTGPGAYSLDGLVFRKK